MKWLLTCTLLVASSVAAYAVDDKRCPAGRKVSAVWFHLAVASESDELIVEVKSLDLSEENYACTSKPAVSIDVEIVEGGKTVWSTKVKPSERPIPHDGFYKHNVRPGPRGRKSAQAVPKCQTANLCPPGRRLLH